MKRTLITIALLAAFAPAFGQVNYGVTKEQKEHADELTQVHDKIAEAERDGVNVRMKDIGRFRGVRANMLQGFGLVIGLAGTGDSQQTQLSATLLENALKRWGTIIDPTKFKPKNVAVVMVTAELPPFAAPGNTIDVTVSSFGDAKSLQGGTLVLTPLYGPSDFQTVIAAAQGSISIGGFNASAGGTTSRKNHPNVGRIPNGAIVETGVQTQTVFEGNKLYFELYVPDLTTAQRVADALSKELPDYKVAPVDGGTIEITLPEKNEPILAMSKIEQTTVHADVPAVVVVNERTGTVVIGGNVKIGPAVVAHGSLQIRIDEIPFVSQPPPLSSGTTVAGSQNIVNAEEGPTQIGVIPPNTTIDDLAKILQTLQVSARDIIAILQALADQGALKAKIRIQ
ncbi:MAG TPA: flagellar basal body P-ring protein FlgI [Fimbriimonadaceae bacterium]|nr:flagellar basal body P-ring protein FlgI [Fimbriimonadaceae bacterium]